MSAALTAQPGLHSATSTVRRKAAKSGAKRKRKKNTMAGGACATESRLANLSAARDDAQAAHKLAQQKMKERITSKYTPWKVGDKV